MKATTRRRFTAFVVAMVSGFSTLSVANAAALEIQNNSVTDAGTQATQAQETIDFTHTFRIGNQGFYFKVYDMNGIEISHDEFVDDEKECTLVRFYKTEADTKQLDLLQAYEFECGHVDSWSYRGFEYDNIGISEISPAVSDEIKGRVQDLCLFIVVFGKKLCDTHAFVCAHQEPDQYGLASAPVEPRGFNIKHAGVHSSEVCVPFRMVFTRYSVISCKNFHVFDFNLSS